MKLIDLHESKVGNVHVALSKMVTYLERKLGTKLIKIAGVEHYHNSKGNGFGYRYAIDGTLRMLRFNWASKAKAGNAGEIISIDIFAGKKSPSFTITAKNISLVKTLPALVSILHSPTLGKKTVFPVNANEALTEQLSEAKRDDYSSEQVLDHFFSLLIKGRGMTRSDFITQYHIIHVGIFDTILADFSDQVEINNRRITLGGVHSANLGDPVKLKQLKKEILLSAGILEVEVGGTNETYSETKAEADAQELTNERVTYSDTLDHLEGLVTGIVKGAFNALFVSGPGGCLSGETLLNVKVVETSGQLLGPVSLFQLEQLALKEHNIDSLEFGRMYKLKNVQIETPNGFKDVLGLVRKQGTKAVVEFKSGIIHTCLNTHLFIGEEGNNIRARDLKIGDKIRSGSSVDEVKAVNCTEEDMIAYDLSVDSLDGIYVTADGIHHHNTGKTQTVERVLEEHGLSDGQGYYKNTGTASGPGVFTLLYHNRKNIVLFDDSDGALADQDARNIIKAATDTKKKRKLSWNKRSSFIYDPEDKELADELSDDANMAPKYFDFEGRIIFISNLPLNKLDPDGALRTRAFIINVDPTPEEMFEYMGKILYDIRLEEGLSLTREERLDVLGVVKTSKRPGDVSLRKLVRALNLAASGASNWRKLVELYC